MNFQHRIWDLQARIADGEASQTEIKELEELELQRLDLFISLNVLTGNWQVREAYEQAAAEKAYSTHLKRMLGARH